MRIEQGDGWTLYNADCLDVLPTLTGVDAVVTDPPWKDYETGRYDASEWHRPLVKIAPSLYVPALFRALRPASAMLLWCGWEVFEEHAAAARQAGFVVKNCVVWAKPSHTAGDLEGNLGYRHEMAVFAVKGRWRRHSKREVNLWQESHLFSRAVRAHPSEKPVGLMCRSVLAVAGDDALVLDPFMGSGTTGVACLQTGRRFIGIEIDPGYFDVAVRRIEAAAMQQRLDLAEG